MKGRTLVVHASQVLRSPRGRPFKKALSENLYLEIEKFTRYFALRSRVANQQKGTGASVKYSSGAEISPEGCETRMEKLFSGLDPVARGVFFQKQGAVPCGPPQHHLWHVVFRHMAVDGVIPEIRPREIRAEWGRF